MRAESGGAGQGRSVDRPLIASYSYSGHTHRAAQALQRLTGSDWCEIYPRQPYPMAFPELLAQVKRELKTGYRPKLLPLSHPPSATRSFFWAPPTGAGHSRRRYPPGCASTTCPASRSCPSTPTAAVSPAICGGISKTSAPRRRWGRPLEFLTPRRMPCRNCFPNGWPAWGWPWL